MEIITLFANGGKGNLLNSIILLLVQDMQVQDYPCQKPSKIRGVPQEENILSTTGCLREWNNLYYQLKLIQTVSQWIDR